MATYTPEGPSGTPNPISQSGPAKTTTNLNTICWKIPVVCPPKNIFYAKVSQRRKESTKLNDIPWGLALLKAGLISVTHLIVMAVSGGCEPRVNGWTHVTQLPSF